MCLVVFFFQAEVGIRYIGVTGVQTCALLISSRRRHTRYWRDWSSDVCSSDLGVLAERAGGGVVRVAPAACGIGGVGRRAEGCPQHVFLAARFEIGRASC